MIKINVETSRSSIDKSQFILKLFTKAIASFHVIFSRSISKKKVYFKSKILTQFDEVDRKDETICQLLMELFGTSFVQNKEIPLAKKK